VLFIRCCELEISWFISTIEFDVDIKFDAEKGTKYISDSDVKKVLDSDDDVDDVEDADDDKEDVGNEGFEGEADEEDDEEDEEYEEGGNGSEGGGGKSGGAFL
jgi:hypothetical protein